LTAHLEKTIWSEKMIEEDLSQVEESATKSTYKLGVGFERCEDKDEKSALKFIPSSTYHKDEATIKPTKAHYPSNPKPSFNPKREVRKETPKSRDEAFICMFYGRAGHLDEFCFRRKRIERRRFDYAINSYCDEFSNFPPHSFSHALPHTSSRALHQFAYGPNHCSCGLVHKRTTSSLDTLVTAHVLIVVIISRVGMFVLLEGPTPTLSRDTWMIHVFPIVVHVPLNQVVRCKGL
jgi:hypothetical protein